MGNRSPYAFPGYPLMSYGTLSMSLVTPLVSRGTPSFSQVILL
jgi:hypothetical protein